VPGAAPVGKGRIVRAFRSSEAHASFDATKDREASSETPGIPPEMKEVVEVVFRCNQEDR